MSTLIVATNHTAPDLASDVAAGRHPKVDYFELMQRLPGDLADYGQATGPAMLARLEDTLRLDVRLACEVVRQVRAKGYTRVISLSERVGIPLACLLPARVHHDVIFHHPMSPHKVRMLRLLGLARRWRTIIAISDAEAEGLCRALALEPGHNVVSLPTPVDTEFFTPICVPLSEQTHIKSLGQSHRDYQTLFKAMSMLPAISCHVRVGSSWTATGSGIAGLPIPANITVKHYVSPALLRERYARCRFVVVPILNDTQWSAGCTTIQQAQAMGRAVIASDRPGLASYIRHGETGLLVRTGDAQEMAEAIDYLWRNPKIAADMGRNGRELMERALSLPVWLERMATLSAMLGWLVSVL